MDVQVGSRVLFPWGKKREMKEGVVVDASPKAVRLRVDFEQAKGRIVIRKMHEVRLA